MPYGDLLRWKEAESYFFENCEKHTCGICGEDYIGSDMLSDAEGGVVYGLPACPACFAASTIEDLVRLLLKKNLSSDVKQVRKCLTLQKTAGEWFRN